MGKADELFDGSNAHLLDGEGAVDPQVKPFDSYAPYLPWSPPFHHECGCIFDSQQRKVLDVRGWGFLTGQGIGGKGLDHDVAAKVQDDLGKRIAALMNRDSGGSLSIPTDPRTGKPMVTSAMKAECIGEFSFDIEMTCYSCHEIGVEEGCEVCDGEVDYMHKATVPWTTCKDIYKAMAVEAAKA